MLVKQIAFDHATQLGREVSYSHSGSMRKTGKAVFGGIWTLFPYFGNIYLKVRVRSPHCYQHYLTLKTPRGLALSYFVLPWRSS